MDNPQKFKIQSNNTIKVIQQYQDMNTVVEKLIIVLNCILKIEESK